jgi:glycosyltransferase involved in cell wall biosynthesis
VADRIRVLRIIARLNVGGPAIHATLLTEGLDPARYETRLVAGATPSVEGDYLALHGRSIPGLEIVPGLGRELHPLRDLGAYRHLLRLMRDFKPQIVHTHTAKAGVLGRLAAWRSGVPIILHTFHGHVFRGYFSRPKEAFFVWLERRLAGITTRLITVSEQVRDEILARGVGRPDQFEVIRLGFDLSGFLTRQERTGTIRNELQLTPATPLVGIVARLVPIKAHEVFLEVAARVSRERPDAVFVIVGDGECRHALEATVRYKEMMSSVRFLGWRSDLDRVYSDLDVVVLTSRNEGSPVALIEAMACAKPVVATRVGGVPELVGDSGLLTDVDDAPALARAVLQLLADPALASRLGQHARRRVASAFSRDRLVGDIDALYQRVLAGRS